MSRAKDTSAEAVARAFFTNSTCLRRCDRCTWNICDEHLVALLRTRDAAWWRIVREVRTLEESCAVGSYAQGWRDACDRILAAAPGRRGRKGDS